MGMSQARPEDHVFDDPAALEAFGAALVANLVPGTVVLLIGPMGAGKTTLCKGLARGLGSDAIVTSPTYTYIHQYPSPQGVFVHVDAYRLEDPHRLFSMGLEELIESARLIAIEWGEGLVDRLEHALVIRLEPMDNGRKLRLERTS
jgi:tRNA threonylcarbamoyladenosine biosynthesis protein TsaE